VSLEDRWCRELSHSALCSERARKNTLRQDPPAGNGRRQTLCSAYRDDSAVSGDKGVMDAYRLQFFSFL